MTSPRTAFSQVAPGVHRLTKADVNCYLIADGEGLSLVDTGLPAMWPDLVGLLGAVGATPADIDAVLLTHGHFDHVGMSRRLIIEHGTAHHVHERDRHLARHPYSYKPAAPRGLYPLRHPRAIPILARMVAAGALWVRGVDAAGDVVPGTPLEVPGLPVPVFSPGHTGGHCAFFLPEQGVLLSGDALVTLDPYTGETGPRIVANAATADAAEAVASLEALRETEARVVAPGHGEPLVSGIEAAVHAAARAGVA